MSAVFKINGVVVKPPSTIDYDLSPVVTDENRLEDASLILRPVADKRKVVWNYDYIIGSDLIKILGESWEKYVNNKTYKFRVSMPNYNGGQLEFDAYFASPKFKLVIWHDDPNYRVYSNFSMTWIEY